MAFPGWGSLIARWVCWPVWGPHLKYPGDCACAFPWKKGEDAGEMGLEAWLVLKDWNILFGEEPGAGGGGRHGCWVREEAPCNIFLKSLRVTLSALKTVVPGLGPKPGFSNLRGLAKKSIRSQDSNPEKIRFIRQTRTLKWKLQPELPCRVGEGSF